MLRSQNKLSGLSIRGKVEVKFLPILTDKALQSIIALHRHLEPQRKELLKNRDKIEEQILGGDFPTFPPETQNLRDDLTWKVHPIPENSKAQQRAVDVVCWKTFDENFFLQCLSSGADGIQFDFDDSFAPTWDNCLQSQLNLLSHGCRTDRTPKNTPLVLVRPRSINLDEAHVLVDGEIVAGALFDFALWVHTWFYNTSPEFKDECYFYVPKIENYLEARWWNSAFEFLENYYSLKHGTFKAVVLIENILAAFQMEEIVYEMRDHCLGLNTGKWDYIFSYIKKFRNVPTFLVPERSVLGMDQPFLAAYEKLLVDTCRRRGCFATGGMAPQLSTTDDDTNQKIYIQILKEKKRGVVAGLQGELIADPAFVQACRDAYTPLPPYDEPTTQDPQKLQVQLLTAPTGPITDTGIFLNVNVSLRYISGWFRGLGTVALGAVEDIATAEISRSLLWQWVKHGAKTTDGAVITLQRVLGVISHCQSKIRQELGDLEFENQKFEIAQQILIRDLLDTSKFVGFLPDVLYPQIVKITSAKL